MRFRLLFLMLIAMLNLSLPIFAQELRIVYFHPKGAGPPNLNAIDGQLDILIKRVQKLFENQVGKTFEIEQENGKAKVHHFLGKEDYTGYRKGAKLNAEKIRDEISNSGGYLATEMSSYLYLIAANIIVPPEVNLPANLTCGQADYLVEPPWWKRLWEEPIDSPWAVIDVSEKCFHPIWEQNLSQEVWKFRVWITAHELGHAFGLQHDFVRPLSHTYIMSYGRNPHPDGPFSQPTQLSQCTKEWLNASRFFNPNLTSPPDQETEITLNSALYSPENTNLHLEFTATDADGLRAAQLFLSSGIILFGCQSLNGQSDLIEFNIPNFSENNYEIAKDEVKVQVIDSYGYIIRKKFSLRQPIAVGSITDLTLTVDETETLDASDYFRTDLSRLSYSAHSDNKQVLETRTRSASSIITLIPQNAGSALVTVTASAGGFAAIQRFTVTVRPRYQPPELVDTIPNQTLTVGDSATPLDLSTYFQDPNGKTLTYTVELSNPDPVLPQVIGSQLTISAWNIGSTTITVKATNTDDLFTTQNFTVSVAAEENRAPVAVDTLPDQTLTNGDSSAPLDLSTYFRYPDGDPLTYTVVSSDPNVATTQRVGSQLTIWTLNVGNTTVTVRATDANGLFTTQTFTVTVTANEIPTERPTPPGLSNGDAIIVQNTGNDGLNIRSAPQVRNQNPDNRIGKVYDGATGTLIAGPRESDGYIWWEVQWDAANNRGWSVEAIGAVGLLARRPPEPVTQSFDLEIQPLSFSKQTLDPSESFTLSITIHNNGPGDSPGPALSYYHSLSPGFSPTDPPQLQGTLSLGPLASGESRTQLIQLEAPTTPKAYYYGAWLSANTGDTNLNNDFATEVAVTVIDDTIDDPIEASGPPDLVIENISVDSDTMYPGERFTISATVRNMGGRQAANARVRYYRSSDEIYSPDDEEIANTTDSIGRLEGGETSDETANLDAPDEQGVYYYIARAESVRNEVDTSNNYEAVKITVLPPAAPDLAVSLTSTRYVVDPDQRFLLDATVLNQGQENTRARTTVRFYRSSDSHPSPDDEVIGTRNIRTLREGSTDRAPQSDHAPSAPGGVSYYYACVDSVSEERNTDNNCSNVVTITVRAPDLVVNSVSVDYFSRTNTVRPDGIFELDVTVRNQGTEDADDSTLRYYISSDTIRSSDDTEVATDFVFSLDMNETSRTYKSDAIRVPYTSGFFYALVCVDGVEAESDTANNCYTPIKLTVTNFGPRADGVQFLHRHCMSEHQHLLDVSGYFADANNDDLTYTASSSAPNIVTVGVSGAQVTFTPHRSGSGTATVTASDGEFTATQTVSVSVLGAEAWMPDTTLRATVRAALGLQPNDVLTQQMMTELTVLNAASGSAGTGVQDITGLEHATQLTNLNLGRTGVRDLTPLQDLTYLTHLTLWYTNISDLTPLQGLTNLTYLNLHQTTPRGISPLQGLTNLTYLDIGRTQITDITPLRGLTALTSLDLSFNNANNFNTPGDLTPLSSLTALTSLNLGYTVISDITVLQGLTALTYLDLKNNQISDISPISGLTNLVRLYLKSNQISDVSALEGLTSLQFLTLEYNPIADMAPLGRLKEKHPNVSIDVDIEVQAPDLRVDSVNVSKNTVTPGETFRLDAVVTNQGASDASAITVRYYQSTDDTISTTDTERQTATLELIAVDGMREPWAQLTAPDTPGTYYYGVCIDAVEGETDTNNNCSIAVAVTVEGADLRIDGTPQVSKTTLAVGETFQINTRVWNQGSATSDPTTLRYYLSTDDTISPEDTEVDSDRVDALSGRGASAPRRRAELSKTLTAPDTAGVHYYGVCVDSVAGDANTLNNCSQAIAITVEAPPPEPVVVEVPTDAVEIQGPDLIISTVRVDAATIKIGGGVRFHITLTNQGTNKAPATIIRYYRSSDATISAEDTELRAVPVGELGSGKSYTTWALLPSPFAVGVYYYGACLDAVASEFDTTNNCSDAIEITTEAQGKPLLVAIGSISRQVLWVGGPPQTLNVSGHFVGKVETWTASSSKPSVVIASMSDSKVILTPVGKKDGQL